MKKETKKKENKRQEIKAIPVKEEGIEKPQIESDLRRNYKKANFNVLLTIVSVCELFSVSFFFLPFDGIVTKIGR